MPTSYWGKFSSVDGLIEWLSLEYHLVDVAACLQVLLEAGYAKPLRILNGGKALSKQQISRLCVLALVHDIGKAIWDFQRQIFEDENTNRRHRGHTTVSCSLLLMPFENSVRKSFMSLFPNFQDWFAYPDQDGKMCFASMLLSAWGHHGKPVEFDFEFRPNEDDLMKVRWDDWNYLDFSDLVGRLQEIISAHWPEFSEGSIEPLTASGPFMTEFNGLLTLADWMASDKRYFVYDHGSGTRYDLAIRTAQAMLEKSGRGRPMAEKTFEEIFDFKPNAMQKEFMDIGERLYQ